MVEGGLVGRCFIHSDRDQLLLLPPDLREWLAPNHRALLIMDVVEQFDLSVFYAASERQPRGRPGYAPRVMVALVVYAYSSGVRSSRELERRCQDDVAFRVLTANQAPDHATIARFRATYAAALAGLFVQVLALCAEAGLGKLGVIAIDGTKIAAAAARGQNRTRAQLPALRAQLERTVATIFQEAAAIDAAEDARYGERRGDELPEHLTDPAERRRALRRAQRRLADLDAADAELARRDQAADAAHAERLAELQRTAAARGQRPRGRKPAAPTRDPAERVNLTDPESRLMQAADNGWVQGYNAQLAVTDDHLIIAADITTDHTDHHQLQPLISHSRANAAAANISEPLGTILADHGYFTNANATLDSTVLIAPGNLRRTTIDPTLATTRHRLAMHERLTTPEGRALYKRRSATVEPVIGTLKQTRNGRRFTRRGLTAARHEWQLMALVHNLLRLLNHQQAPHTV